MKQKARSKKKEVRSEFVSSLDRVFVELRSMLIVKNAKYGNSALKPKRIFSASDEIEQLNVRIDDKLSRIEQQTKLNLGEDEDAELHLLGYLILRRVAKKKMEDPEFNLMHND